MSQRITVGKSRNFGGIW